MTERPEFGVQEFRETVRTRVDKTWAEGEISVITRHGQRVALFAPVKYLAVIEAYLADHGEPPAA